MYKKKAFMLTSRAAFLGAHASRKAAFSNALNGGKAVAFILKLPPLNNLVVN